MEAKNMEFERTVIPELGPSVGFSGVRECDEFVLDIFQDKKRFFKLNRTKYVFTMAAQFEFDFIKAKIKLPYFGDDAHAFELILINHSLSKGYDSKSRYLFRSLGDAPFRLNGTYSFEAFLERGDVIDLGFNRIFFPRPGQADKNSENVLEKRFIESLLPILLEGETGTGKTTLAKRIHDESGRPGRFVHLNLSAFSKGLIESELFGHVKGAFTGALNSKKGAILEAHRGTLFLDEVDSLSIDIQTKLLLFLDDFHVRAVGGENHIKADVRMIFASGTSLKKQVESDKMRRDFYYRLQSSCSVVLRSLREDPERVRKFCREFEEKHMVVLSPELIDFYSTCQWPGNVRQLKYHLLKKKILSNGKKIIFDDSDKVLMSEQLSLPKIDMNELVTLEKMKVKYCYSTFLKLDCNIARTAKVLEVSPNTLKATLARRDEGSRDDNVVHINL